MKSTVLYVLIAAFFWSLVGYNVPAEALASSVNDSASTIQSKSAKSNQFELSSADQALEDFAIEIEIEEEEEEEDQHLFCHNPSFESLFLPQVCKQLSSISFCSPRKLIKLYILFHSWRSFLDFQV